VTTIAVPPSKLAKAVDTAVPGAVAGVAAESVIISRDELVAAAAFMRDTRELDGRFLNAITGIDRHDRFEVAYVLSSLSHNHTFTVRVEADHEEPEIPSVASVWHGAHLQEREIYDLMGIRFAGHPDLKRLFLWDTFPGHPLRKDFLTLPGGEHPGLQRFPNEDPAQWGGQFRVD
jgi:NADH-quinone oxidoreductase subunit C